MRRVVIVGLLTALPLLVAGCTEKAPEASAPKGPDVPTAPGQSQPSRLPESVKKSMMGSGAPIK